MSHIVAPVAPVPGMALRVRRPKAMPQFQDRRHAGRLLAAQLLLGAHGNSPVVLALPRGGVPVAFEAARTLRAPLDVLVVRKLGVPGQEELAMGAVASGGLRVLNREIIEACDIPDRIVEEVTARERAAVVRRENLYRGSKAAIPIMGRDAILVDDGLATGSTMRVAIAAARTGQPRRVIIAVPVGARSTCTDMAREADEVVCLMTPEPFEAVGQWYEDFGETTDEEVREYLKRGGE